MIVFSCHGRLADSPFECLCQTLGVTLDLKDLDCAVGGAGGEAAPIVVEDSIVLENRSQCQPNMNKSQQAQHRQTESSDINGIVCAFVCICVDVLSYHRGQSLKSLVSPVALSVATTFIQPCRARGAPRVTDHVGGLRESRARLMEWRKGEYGGKDWIDG